MGLLGKAKIQEKKKKRFRTQGHFINRDSLLIMSQHPCHYTEISVPALEHCTETILKLS